MVKRGYELILPPHSLRILNIEELKQEGWLRQKNHAFTDRDSERTQDDENHEHGLGFIGEASFSWLAGCPMDQTLRREGDGGIDHVWNCMIINPQIRDLRSGSDLLRRTTTCEANTIYPLGWLVSNIVKWMGWISGAQLMTKVPIPSYSRNLGCSNYVWRADELPGSMDSLLRVIQPDEVTLLEFRRTHIAKIEFVE
jgi:hypothetical protein